MSISKKRCPVCNTAVQLSTTSRAEYQRKRRKRKRQELKEAAKEEHPDKCMICLEKPNFDNLSVPTSCECSQVAFTACRPCLEKYIQNRLRPENLVSVNIPVRDSDGVLRRVRRKVPQVRCLKCNHVVKPRRLAGQKTVADLTPDSFLRRLSPHLQRIVTRSAQRG